MDVFYQPPPAVDGATGPQGPPGIQGIQGAPGTQGIQGVQGPQGSQGAVGSQILTGSGIPSSGLGVNSDFYVNIASGDYYKKVSGSWGSPLGNLTGPQGIQGIQGVQGIQGIQGTTGTTGAAGSQILTGSGVPSGGTGVNSDFYLNATNGDYYKKTSGSWGSPLGNLTGPAGSATLTVAARNVLCVDDSPYNAVGNGSTDDRTAINAAINALASRGGGTLFFSKAAYAIGGPLDGSVKNVKLQAIAQGTKLIMLASGTSYPLQTIHGGVGNPYRDEYWGWKISGFEFLHATPSASLLFQPWGAAGLCFEDCKFRNVNLFMLSGVRDVRFDRCGFYGTTPGVMQSGTWEPTPVPGAVYWNGPSLNSGAINVTFNDCLFHFCLSGLNGSMSGTQRSRGLTLQNCYFRGDWWKSPYIRSTWSAVSYLLAPPPNNYPDTMNIVVTGDATGHFPTVSQGGYLTTLSIGVDIATGSEFATNSLILPPGRLQTSTAIPNARVGDVFETISGKRAEILAVENTTTFWTLGWESMDTFEAADFPDWPNPTNSWRLRRYYGSTVFSVTYNSGTNQTTLFVGTPRSPFTGTSMVTDDGFNVPANWHLAEMAQLSYSGINIANNIENLFISNCHFRGSASDQLSVFYSPQIRVIGNKIEYGADEGMTLTGDVQAQIIGNSLRMNGSGGMAAWICNDAAIMGNTFDGWDYRFRTGNGAIDVSGGLRLHIIGNSAVRAAGPGDTGGLSDTFVRFYNADCTECLVQGNSAPGARTYDIRFDALDVAHGATSGPVYSPDAVRVGGVNVSLIQMPAARGLVEMTGAGSPEGVVTAPTSSRYYRIDGIDGTNTHFYIKQTGTGNTGWIGVA